MSVFSVVKYIWRVRCQSVCFVCGKIYLGVSVQSLCFVCGIKYDAE